MGSFLYYSRIKYGLTTLPERLALARSAFVAPKSVSTATNHHIALKLLCKLCAPGKIFVDVGANRGKYISRVTQKNKHIFIVGVEADVQKCEQLKKRFPYSTILPYSVGAKQTKAPPAKYNPDPQNKTQVELSPNTDETTLDHLIQFGNLDLLHIHIHNRENDILKGAIALIHEFKPNIVFESVDCSDNHAKIELWNFLTYCHYELFLPERLLHRESGMNIDGFLNSHKHPRPTQIYIAVARSRVCEIRARAKDILGS